MQEGDFLYTPKSHIRLGQLCRDDNGNPSVTFKRAKKNEYETIPISELIAVLCCAEESMGNLNNIDSKKFISE